MGDLRLRYRLAISDPGSIVDRESDETVPNWASRAVMAIRDEEMERLRIGRIKTKDEETASTRLFRQYVKVLNEAAIDEPPEDLANELLGVRDNQIEQMLAGQCTSLCRNGERDRDHWREQCQRADRALRAREEQLQLVGEARTAYKIRIDEALEWAYDKLDDTERDTLQAILDPTAEENVDG